MRISGLLKVWLVIAPATAMAEDLHVYGELRPTFPLPVMLGLPLGWLGEPERRIDPIFFSPELFSTVGQSKERAAETHVGTGDAVWYSLKGKTASGEQFNPEKLTGSHRTLPFGTEVRVVNRRTGADVVVRINDRMGNVPRNRKVIIDLSPAAAKRLGIAGRDKVDILRVDGSDIVASDPELGRPARRGEAGASLKRLRR